MIATGPDLLPKQIRQGIKAGLKSGQSKQDLFTSFRTDENENHLRRFLAKFPDKRPKTIYKVLNIIIYVIWAIFALGAFIGLFEIPNVKTITSFLIALFITIELIKFNGNIYLPGIVYFIWGLVEWLFEMHRMTQTGEINEDGSIEAGFMSLFILIATIVLMTIVRRKVFGYFNWFLPYKDDNGHYIFENSTNN